MICTTIFTLKSIKVGNKISSNEVIDLTGKVIKESVWEEVRIRVKIYYKPWGLFSCHNHDTDPSRVVANFFRDKQGKAFQAG